MVNESITDQEAMQLLFDIVGSWDHYYCPKCKRNHQINYRSFIPKPSKIFIEHFKLAKNPNNKKKEWIGKRILGPSIPQIRMYYKIINTVQKYLKPN